jgi:hypothetical protein
MFTNFQSKFTNLSFKTKAIAAVVLLSLVPVVGVGSLAYIVSQNNLRTTEINNQQAQTTAFANALARFISLRGKDIQSVADLPLVKNDKVSKTLSREFKDDFLNSYIERYKFYDSLTILDLKGNVIAASKGSINDNNINRDFFQKALKSGSPYISPIEFSKTGKKSSIYFSAPAKDGITGETIAIVQGKMPISALQKIAEDYESNNAEWHIFDKTTNKFAIDIEEKQTGEDISRYFTSYAKFKTSDKINTIIETIPGEAKQELVSFYNVTGDRDLANLNMSISIAKDMKLITAKENEVLLVLLLGVLISGGTAVGLSLFLGGRVTNFIKQLADSIVTSSGAIVDTVEGQQVTVNMQANSAIDTSKTINELGSISFQSAEQAEASATGARQALSLAEEGAKSVQQTLKGMGSLRTKVDDIAQQIVNLSEQTGQITVVSDLVADLASQTNMLALNAAVEAARAGEQGKGFSVVADEIRKLADQSKKSADKINALANDIQSAINRTVMVTDEGTKTVQEGIDLAEGTVTTFIGVTDAVNNVFLNSQQISTSAKQQAISIQQVLISMAAISQGSQESAVGMHQVKMTTRELTQVADELKAAVV